MKKEGTIPFVASTQESLRLSRNYHLDHLICQLKVNMTCASASLTNGTLLNLLSNIQIISNGDKYHKVLKPIGVNLSQVVDHKSLGLRQVTLADGTHDNYVFFRVDFSLNNMKKAFDTIENTAIFDTFDMVVDWASHAQMGSGVTVNNASLEVSSAHAIDYVRPAGHKILRHIETNATYDVIGDNDQFKIDLTTEQYYDKIFIVATADAVKNDDVVVNITLKSGETVMYNIDALTLRADNITEYQPKAQGDLVGCYVIDFTKLRASLDDLLDTNSKTSPFNTLDLVLNVKKQGTACKIHVFRRTIENTGLVEVSA